MQGLLNKNYLAFAAHTVALGLTIAGFKARNNVVTSTSLKRIAVDPVGTDQPSQCTIDYSVVVQNNGSLSFEYGIYAFFAISAAAHLFYATNPGNRYLSSIAKGWNPYRWFEYALSAGVMSMILAAADGTRDASTVVCLGLLTSAMQFSGLGVEANLKYAVTPNKDSIFAATLCGWLLFITLWGVLGYNFVMAARDVNAIVPAPGQEKPTLPWWLYFIIISQIVYYALFGLAQRAHVQDRLKGFMRFERHENMYINLSFLAKLTLAGGFAYGLIYRTKDCPAPSPG